MLIVMERDCSQSRSRRSSKSRKDGFKAHPIPGRSHRDGGPGKPHGEPAEFGPFRFQEAIRVTKPYKQGHREGKPGILSSGSAR